MISLVSAELLKVRKRRATWIVFGALVAIMAFFFLALRPIVQASEGPAAHGFVLLDQSLRFPQGYGTLATMGVYVGQWLLIVLVALLVGSEYGWGTLRLVLPRGPSRTAFMLAKLVALVTTVVIGSLGMLVVGAIIMPLGDLAAGGFDPAFPDGFAASLALDWLRTTAIVLIYLAIAFAVTLLTRSGGAGLGIGLVFLFVESILTPIFAGLGGFWGSVPRFFPANLVRAVQEANDLGAGQFASETPVELFGPWTAGLALAAYFIVLVGGTVWLFNRRDIAGASA